MALNDILGMKFSIVGGYPSSADVFLAMERGEVQGICESLDSVKTAPAGLDFERHDLGAVPRRHQAQSGIEGRAVCGRSRAKARRQQAIEFLYAGQGIGRPFVAPPGLPPDRLKMLRDAFDATMKDPEFIAETHLRKLTLDPADGEQLEALIKKTYATPKPIIDRIAKLILKS